MNEALKKNFWQRPELELEKREIYDLLNKIKFKKESTKEEIEKWGDKLSKKVCDLND